MTYMAFRFDVDAVTTAEVKDALRKIAKASKLSFHLGRAAFDEMKKTAPRVYNRLAQWPRLADFMDRHEESNTEAPFKSESELFERKVTAERLRRLYVMPTTGRGTGRVLVDFGEWQPIGFRAYIEDEPSNITILNAAGESERVDNPLPKFTSVCGQSISGWRMLTTKKLAVMAQRVYRHEDGWVAEILVGKKEAWKQQPTRGLKKEHRAELRRAKEEEARAAKSKKRHMI